ncbi:unnamed protein product [Spodoptera littoralis]|uniref:Uncharacterized protein n=1 Tax=Spodoptera littoralis TaxID=7109 RepID=A0A9P0I3M8_SPOLI|nr:unnamed protein product [Spodoptera littoralis]CAH1640756.1 unnamed protein product [Spodoptera littoralis]
MSILFSLLFKKLTFSSLLMLLKTRRHTKAKSVKKEGSILPISVAASEKLRTNVLSLMNIDEISLIVKQDDLILKLGSKPITKHDQDPHLSGYISQKMRELARFLIEIRKICPAIQNLTECINPIYFPKDYLWNTKSCSQNWAFP